MRSRFWLAVYYGIYDHSFAREQRSFLAGKNFFDGGCLGAGESSSVLRRSVHRIEKGLVSVPRRAFFATEYIESAVEAYRDLLERKGISANAELAWAHDVFVEYFRVCDDQPNVLSAKAMFAGLRTPLHNNTNLRAESRSPYKRGLGRSSMAYEDLLELSNARRSIRWYQNRAVPREDIRKAVAVATMSPSACNRQPFTFRIFDKEPFLSIAAGLPPGTRGYEHQFPCVIAVVGHQRYYSEERDRHLIYIDGSLATMSFILALETLGLSSCCINWPDIEERELAAEKALKLGPDERIVMFIAVGYADPEGLIPYSEKRAPEELCRFNFE